MFTTDFWNFLVKLHESWASDKTLGDLQAVLSERMSLRRQAPSIEAVEHCDIALKVAPVSLFIYTDGHFDENKAVLIEQYRLWIVQLKKMIKEGKVKCDQ